jgi:hypothetical protein
MGYYKLTQLGLLALLLLTVIVITIPTVCVWIVYNGDTAHDFSGLFLDPIINRIN